MARLGSRPNARRFVAEHAGGQSFQRHVAVQALVVGAIHHTHPARTELFQNPVMRNRRPDHLHTLAHYQVNFRAS
jgi:hypothetical protein